MLEGAEIGVASVGDPRSTATWSGTARNLIDALQRKGLRVAPFDCQAPMAVRLAHFAAYASRFSVSLAVAGRRPRLPIDSRLVFGRSDFLRSTGMRKRHAELLRRQVSEKQVRHVLHMSNLAVPVEKDEVKHYLFCDSTWHSLTCELFGEERRPLGYWRRFEEAEKAVIARVSHFFVTSQYVAQDLVGHYGVDPVRVAVVGSGLGQTPPLEGERDYLAEEVLFVARGRFEEKGGPLLVEAFRKVLRKLPNAHLTLVGDPRYPGWFESTTGVTGMGPASKPELDGLFRRASLFAMPALVEPWGLVYLEALASGVPILGLRRQAFPELAGDGRYGFIVDEPDPDHVAQAIVAALGDSERLDRMGRTGRERCLQEFSWDLVAQRIIDAAGLQSREPASLR